MTQASAKSGGYVPEPPIARRAFPMALQSSRHSYTDHRSIEYSFHKILDS